MCVSYIVHTLYLFPVTAMTAGGRRCALTAAGMTGAVASLPGSVSHALPVRLDNDVGQPRFIKKEGEGKR